MGWGDIPGDAIRLIRTHGTDGMERLRGCESRVFVVLYRVTTGSIRSARVCDWNQPEQPSR